MRIFLDANILFSAARSDGAIRRMIRDLREAGHELIADEYVVAEAVRNLEIKAAAALDDWAGLIKMIHREPLVPPPPTWDPTLVPLPEKDRPVLAAAIRLRCEALVTGDRTHFSELYRRTVAGVAIHAPRSLAETLLEDTG